MNDLYLLDKVLIAAVVIASLFTGGTLALSLLGLGLLSGMLVKRYLQNNRDLKELELSKVEVEEELNKKLNDLIDKRVGSLETKIAGLGIAGMRRG
jgi:hypothetical protein